MYIIISEDLKIYKDKIIIKYKMLPKVLVNAFNLGQSQVSCSTADLNGYAKFMQNLSIPRTTIKFVLEDENNKDDDIEFETYFKQFDDKENDTMSHIKSIFDVSKVDVDTFDSRNDFVSALNHRDKLYKYYSKNVREKMDESLIGRVYTNFMKLYDVNIYRPFKIKKANILASIQNRMFHAAVLHLYSRVLDINIIIIDGNTYDICCNYDKNKETVMFVMNGEKFSFVVGELDDSALFGSHLVESSKERNQKSEIRNQKLTI